MHLDLASSLAIQFSRADDSGLTISLEAIRLETISLEKIGALLHLHTAPNADSYHSQEI